ncbi:NUDIX domain-containing protein [Vreelandella nanhaiensis]|uniref:NUDIX domain-containing protein n=1 Tax=Vreelandella nanhaiensis TaxID=1258546 RepID=A0A3S1DUD8_9GAMM|nr:NUDIX domain-containing protein [Halomonas nanhaiensis]RUR34315.1 NUDIX domain-containing protein [Halomonas nanhaiensis]
MSHLLETRRWVRLAIVNAKGELLLFRSQNEQQPKRWYAPGGLLIPEEDYPGAARRVLEETTHLACPLGPLLREREGLDEEIDSEEPETAGRWCERYFLVRCPKTMDIEDDSNKAFQAAGATCRWWPMTEMFEESSDIFEPTWLPELLASVLTSEPPLPSDLPASV